MKKIGFLGVLMVAAATSAEAQQPPKSPPPEIPAAQRPPKGMCRIWLKDVPAAQQPAPTDCASAVKNCPPNGTVIFGDTEESKDKPRLEPKSYGPKKSTPVIKPPLIRKPPGS